MTNLFIKKFIKNWENIKDSKVRESYGYLGSIVGIVANIFLFAIKIAIGFFLNSISVVADAFNNLSDVASSVVTLIGFKMTNKPADREHPFGHGRIEYISALIVSFLVLMVGVEFIKSSISRILNPQRVEFDIIALSILALSIGVKLWLSRFNKTIGEAIGSKAMEASSFDSLSDVITTSVVILSILMSRFITFPIDGYIGLVVALFILYAGYNIAKDTLDPLLGDAPNPELVDQIIKKIMSYEGIVGTHDLIVHNYGPGRCIASIHAEVPESVSILKSHDIIDRAEKEISKELGVFIVIHMDPINTDCEFVATLHQDIIKIILDIDSELSIHDFRVVDGEEHKNLLFDMVVPYKYDNDGEQKIVALVKDRIKEKYLNYDALITIDRQYGVF